MFKNSKSIEAQKQAVEDFNKLPPDLQRKLTVSLLTVASLRDRLPRMKMLIDSEPESKESTLDHQPQM